MGFGLFLYLYLGRYEGRATFPLENPFIISLFLIPFLPAAILTYMASRVEKRYKAMMGKQGKDT